MDYYQLPVWGGYFTDYMISIITHLDYLGLLTERFVILSPILYLFGLFGTTFGL